ncbi:MAG: preprotein translocase subunit SecA, partial [bacterium]|nr:preprotein translocase subunit SecA [bacterium]
LPEKLRDLKVRRQERNESPQDLLPETFALVREAARRALNERPFDVQVMGGIALHEGNIAEMKTGEGKTLVATMPVVLNALAGKGVHLVTVNEYLARRDAEWMGKVYRALGLTVGVTLHGQTAEEKRVAYAADITYGTNNEFGFDYLRDNMAYRPTDRAQRALHYAIVDEVDSILIDEARTPLIISAPDEESTKHYTQFSKLVPKLERGKHYEVDEKQRAATLTDEGISKTEELLGVQDLYGAGEIRLIHHLEQALRANTLFKRDVDYVVKDGEVIIVDAFTGRLMPGRRYSEGLHQAIEAKEGAHVQAESRTLATITFQNYFRLYDKLAGMTGTAYTSREEFQKVYDLDVVIIPTNKTMVRTDHPDRIYGTEEAKFRAVVKEIRERHEKGQPVLVGTIAIEKSERLSGMLKREGVPHEVLNAKQHDREAQIVANAGARGAVTISTNMAGRGTDIKLGPEVTTLGGLCVLGTERHEARRIDNQLRGRSGRQGDPGESRFLISLDDDIMRIFGGERMKGLLERLKVPEDEPIESGMVSKAVEAAQAKVEGFYFDSRKHVLEYDDVMNKQRDSFYRLRQSLAEEKTDQDAFRAQIADILTEAVTAAVQTARATASPENDLDKVSRDALQRYINLPDDEWEKIASTLPREAGPELLEETRAALQAFVEHTYDHKTAEFPQGVFPDVVRTLFLQTLDLLWTDHLDTMEYLRTGIGLRGYAQRDPLVEYRQESHHLFKNLLAHFREEAASAFFHVTIHPHAGAAAPPPPIPQPEKLIVSHPTAPAPTGAIGQEVDERTPAGVLTSLTPAPAVTGAAGGTSGPLRPKPPVGRNDPCPCGSGKKYKKCHGR